jgi:hypothetical protein
VPRARPVLSSGVAGGKPGLVWKFGVVPPIPVDGLLVRGAAPAVEATSIKPLAIKLMEVSFIWSSCCCSAIGGPTTPANGVPRQSVAATNTEEAPAFGGTGASELALMDRLCLGSRGGEPIHLSPERAVMQIVPAA